MVVETETDVICRTMKSKLDIVSKYMKYTKSNILGLPNNKCFVEGMLKCMGKGDLLNLSEI